MTAAILKLLKVRRAELRAGLEEVDRQIAAAEVDAKKEQEAERPEFTADDEGFWTADQVASFLKLHPKTVYAKAMSGEIPSVLVGERGRRFSPADVREWASGRRPTPARILRFAKQRG